MLQRLDKLGLRDQHGRTCGVPQGVHRCIRGKNPQSTDRPETAEYDCLQAGKAAQAEGLFVRDHGLSNTTHIIAPEYEETRAVIGAGILLIFISA